MNQTSKRQPQTRKMTIVRGKGTPAETRFEIDVTLYWHAPSRQWVTIPPK